MLRCVQQKAFREPPRKRRDDLLFRANRRMTPTTLSEARSILNSLAAQSAQLLNLGKRLKLEPGIGRRTEHVDDEKLTARLTHHIADDRQAATSAVEQPQRDIEVSQGIARTVSLQAHCATGELDRINDRRAVIDPECDVRGIE